MVNLLAKPWYKKWWGVLIILFSALILILIVAFIFAITNRIKQFKNSPEQQQKLLGKINYTEARKKEVEGENNYWLGAAKPKATIVEFADFSCPMCRNSYSKIREISVKYNSNVKIIFRDYPGLEHSLELAMAGRCAGEQGLFWLMHDKLFQNQGIHGKKQLIKLANQVGADLKKFTICLDTQKYLKNIQKDFADANVLGVTGTPTWFINGVKIEGDIPYELFIQIIEKLIQE